MRENVSTERLKEIFSEDYKEEAIFSNETIESPHPLMIDEKFVGEIILNRLLDNSDALSGENVSGVKFFNCYFKDCDLTGVLFWMCSFENCVFQKCTLERTVFRKCHFDKVQFYNCKSRFYLNISESYVYETIFKACSFEGIEISGTDNYDVEFCDCSLSMGRFQANFTHRYNLAVTPEEYLTDEDRDLLESEEVYDDLIFHRCFIDFMDFRMIEFIDVRFSCCEIVKCAFSNCKLYDYTIDQSNNKKGSGTNNIDISTLVRSDTLSKETLENVFTIGVRIQSNLKDSMRKKIFSSVFISYSLEDSWFANKINSYLKSKGVTTFLWEKDAVGGTALKSLMKSNIEANDRLLFIASKSSLKSEACHFELTEGRSKQDRLWKTILFPIHIDSFLFDIEFDQIRPRQKRDEYWENIHELREINSLDFSKTFSKNSIKQTQFGQNMELLIESLRME